MDAKKPRLRGFGVSAETSAAERAATATASVSTAAAISTTTAASVTTLTAAACGQAVDAGACGVWLSTCIAIAATRLIATSKLVGHQGVDVARQFITIAARTAITSGCVVTRRALVTAGVKTTFWATAFAGSFATFSAAVKAGPSLRSATA